MAPVTASDVVSQSVNRAGIGGRNFPGVVILFSQWILMEIISVLYIENRLHHT
jgi:hypothetical protein